MIIRIDRFDIVDVIYFSSVCLGDGQCADLFNFCAKGGDVFLLGFMVLGLWFYLMRVEFGDMSDDTRGFLDFGLCTCVAGMIVSGIYLCVWALGLVLGG